MRITELNVIQTRRTENCMKMAEKSSSDALGTLKLVLCVGLCDMDGGDVKAYIFGKCRKFNFTFQMYGIFVLFYIHINNNIR